MKKNYPQAVRIALHAVVRDFAFLKTEFMEVDFKGETMEGDPYDITAYFMENWEGGKWKDMILDSYYNGRKLYVEIDLPGPFANIVTVRYA